MGKTVIFRCDSSNKIGTGHTKRCINLAEELFLRDCKIIFLVLNLKGNINHQIPDYFNIIEINEVPSSQENDAINCIKILKKYHIEKIDITIIDNYYLDKVWEEKFKEESLRTNLIKKEESLKLIAIDDMANRKHSVDILVDQNYFGKITNSRYDNLTNKNCVKLLGPSYAILSKDYINLSSSKIKRNLIRRILIFFGGYDNNKLTLKSLKAINSLKLKNLEIDIVIGENLNEEKEIKLISEKIGSCNLHKNLKSLSTLMIRADLYLGTGGTTTWERAVLNLPSLVITDGINQELFNFFLEKNKKIHLIGKSENIKISDIKEFLIKIFKRKIKLRHPENITDGYGVMRIANLIMGQKTPSYFSEITNKNQIKFLYPILEQNKIKIFSASEKTFSKLIIEKDSRGVPLNLVKYKLLDNEIIYIRKFVPLTLLNDESTKKNTILKIFSFFYGKFLKIHTSGKNNIVNKINKISFHDLHKNNLFKKDNNIANKFLKISIISDKESWINDFIPELITQLWEREYLVSWINNVSDLKAGDICLLLSYSKILNSNQLNLNQHNLVIHESHLPKGQGMSPMTWQILEGKDKIPVTLFEADKELDSGIIYLRDTINLNGDELINEWHIKQAEVTKKLILSWIDNYKNVLENAINQCGESSRYNRRYPQDSELDINQNLEKQINLLRIVDNKKYPAFFKKFGKKYIIQIFEAEE